MLRRIVVVLHEQGVLDDDTMQALGALVAETLNLSIAACGVE